MALFWTFISYKQRSYTIKKNTVVNAITTDIIKGNQKGKPQLV